jgi:dihydrofolate reductase
MRPPIEMEGGTTFHFLDVPPAEALEIAREAADGQDVRLGGGATVIRDFLVAGLVDHMHTVVVPILLGRGVRLWDGLEGVEKDYQVEATSSPSGVTHVTFTRAGV